MTAYARRPTAVTKTPSSISLTSEYWIMLVSERGGSFFIRMSVNIVG
jgi:hypothetical protein